MDADNPGAVMRRCGEIEDAMANVTPLIIQAIADDIRLGEFLKKERIMLAAQIPEEEDVNDLRRKAWIEARITNSDDYTKWVDAHSARKSLEMQVDLLGKRLTACQSVLKRLEREVGGPGVGAGQRNV